MKSILITGGTGSIGQVKGYATLFKRDYEPVMPIQPVIITDELLPDMEFLAKGERVEIFVA